MKICGISDMHGQYTFDVEPCDLLLICGDVIPLEIQFYTKPSKKWFNKVFIPWCEKQPCKKVMFIGGNHDFFICEHEEEVKDMFKDNEKISYLSNSYEEFESVKIYGTPWSKTFGRWWFMKSDDDLNEMFEKDMENITGSDTIISHDAPFGCSDILLQKDCPWATGQNIGTKALRNLIEAVKPKLFLHGHLHSTNHEKEVLFDTDVYNVSLLDENYTMSYKPLYVYFNK